MKNAKILYVPATLILFFASLACSSTLSTPETLPELADSIPSTPTRPPERIPFPTEEIIRGTISIRHSWPESQLPVLAQIIKGFQAYYPNVMFDVLYLPADILYDQYAADTREGIGPSLLFGPAEWGQLLYNEGLISDLSGDINSKDLNLLNQPALQAAQTDSKLIGLPYSIEGVVLFRNNNVITLGPNTFDDLVTLAQTSTQGDVIGAYLERSFFYSGAHLNGLGGQLIDQNNLPGFNNGLGVEWLKLLKAFEQAGPTAYYSDDDLERFKAGKVGWIIDGTWNLEDLAVALGPENLAIDPWPSYQEGRLSGYIQAENIYLNSASKGDDRKAAIKFMSYLVSSEAQTILAGSGRIPSSRQVGASDFIYAPLVAQAIQALAGGTAYPVASEAAVYNQNLDLALRAYLEQGLAPEKALQDAQDAILLGLAQVPPTSQP